MRFQALRQRYRGLWERWLAGRIPPARRVVLNHRRIFIFLTPAGGVFVLLLLVLLLVAINYQNNMVFLLTFLLGSVFAVAIHHTYAYLAGLVLEAGGASPVFAGQMASAELILGRSGARVYPAIELGFDGGERLHCSVSGQAQRLRLDAPMPRRGWARLPRLRIENRYPLGLLRAWSWADIEMSCLVYPRPETASEPWAASGNAREGQQPEAGGADEFHHLRDYQAGDSPRHVAWKTLAKGQPLQTRQYQGQCDAHCWLDWQQFAGLDDETRLSRLCFQVLAADRQGLLYGLRLPGQVIEPGQGSAHREHLLRCLALYGLEGAA